jgi:hypothetical protein
MMRDHEEISDRPIVPEQPLHKEPSPRLRLRWLLEDIISLFLVMACAAFFLIALSSVLDAVK